jgi:hypothetical protein
MIQQRDNCRQITRPAMRRQEFMLVSGLPWATLVVPDVLHGNPR